MRWALDPTDTPPAGLADLSLKEAAARWGLKKAGHAKAQALALGVELGCDEGGRPVWPAAAVPLGDRLALLPVDRAGWLERLQLGWLLTTPEAVALIPSHDRQRVAALDPHGRPFGPDRLRVALGPKVAAMLSQSLRLAELLQRFAAGEVIAGNDPAVIDMHAAATAGAARLAAATGCSPGAKPTGTLRALLRACGWLLKVAGRIKVRGDSRDVLTYTAARMPLPAGVDAEALAAGWLEQLRRPSGAVSLPTDGTHRGEKCPSEGPPPGTAPPRAWPAPPAVPIPWAAGPPPPPPAVPIAA